MTFLRVMAPMVALSLVACNKQAAQPPAVPPSVQYVTVEDRPVTLTTQLPVGALLAATLTGENNDIYLQVGLITTIGVSAKNAILIVKFAEDCMGAGMNAFDAAIEAAKLRLRPILMTSLAFVIGVFPLAISTGAGAGGQNAIGRAVVGGMLSGTILAIFLVPIFFIVVLRLFGRYGKLRQGGAFGAVEHDKGGTAPQGV